jgi:hypothetical protein
VYHLSTPLLIKRTRSYCARVKDVSVAPSMVSDPVRCTVAEPLPSCMMMSSVDHDALIQAAEGRVMVGVEWEKINMPPIEEGRVSRSIVYKASALETTA